jgi:hypothetical protein
MYTGRYKVIGTKDRIYLSCSQIYFFPYIKVSMMRLSDNRQKQFKMKKSNLREV